MASQQISKPSRSRIRDFGAKSSQSEGVLESHLSRVLLSIATLLIGSGYAYSKLSKLAREAFVEAASSILREEKRKVNIARIAASTGLTRTEVSKIVRRSERNYTLERSDPGSRPANVAAGWISDKYFLDSRNKPRPLPFKGGRFDFTALVRKYSGDIPVRAMMIEMRRLGMVSQDAHGVVRLVRPAIEISKTTVSAMQAVSPWVGLLGESARERTLGTLNSNTHKIDLHFDSLPQVNMVMRQLRKRRVAFIQGLSELGTRTQKDGNLSLRITVAVATAKPTQAKAKTKQSSSRG
jgi:hypothetical protein